MPGAPTLPDLDSLDHAALKAIIVAQLAQQETYTAQHQADTTALTSHASEIAHLKLLVAKLQRMLFGGKRVVWAVLCEGVRVKCPHNLCGHLFMRVAV